MEKRLGLTEEELERVEEDLGFDPEDLEDFDFDDRPLVYEIWGLGYSSDMEATDFEYLVDGGYTELEEATKCFEYFSEVKHITELFETNKVVIPADTKHIHLFLEECRDEGDCTECLDVIDEIEIF